MLRATLFNLVALTLVSALALRVPLDPPHRGQNENQVIFDAKDAMGWNLNKLPNPNDTDHLVFETVHSLLQHWPNTRMRNGKRCARLFTPTEYMFFSRPQHCTVCHPNRYTSLPRCDGRRLATGSGMGCHRS